MKRIYKMEFRLKILFVLFGMFTMTCQLNAEYRLPLSIEYSIVNACIDAKTIGRVTKDIRNECISSTTNIVAQECENLYEIDCKNKFKRKQRSGKLKELFD